MTWNSFYVILTQHFITPMGHYLVDLIKTTKSKGFTQSTDPSAIIITHFWWSQVIVHVQGTEITFNHVLCNILCIPLCLDHVDMYVTFIESSYSQEIICSLHSLPSNTLDWKIGWLNRLIDFVLEWLIYWLINWVID